MIDLVAVVTQPDRAGHRRRMGMPAVKLRALNLGVPVLQPAALRGDGLREVLALRPALLVWAAYGNLIPAALLDAAAGRAVNVHASLLPRHRGAAPIAHAILAADHETGVTLMEGTAALDAGPVLVQERVAIRAGENAGELGDRLAGVGAALLHRELPRYVAGELGGVPQDEALATWAPKLRSADGELDLARPAEELARRVRAFTPAPGVWTTFRAQRLLVVRVTVVRGEAAERGMLQIRDGAPHVAAGGGWLRLDEVRPAGKRSMSGADWARGLRDLGSGARLPS